MLERQREGITKAKAAGKHKGRAKTAIAKPWGPDGFRPHSSGRRCPAATKEHESNLAQATGSAPRGTHPQAGSTWASHIRAPRGARLRRPSGSGNMGCKEGGP